jgi:site-specific DNA recombinase
MTYGTCVCSGGYEHLNKFKRLAEVKKLYTAVLLEGYREHTGLIASEKKKFLEQIAVCEKKLSVARNLLVTEKIDAEDYNLMKVEYNAIISKLDWKTFQASGRF